MTKLVNVFVFCIFLGISFVSCGGSGDSSEALYAFDPTISPSPEPVVSFTPSPVVLPSPSPVIPSPSPEPVTLSTIQQDVFTPHCAGCHSPTGAASATGLFLDNATNAFNTLVVDAESAFAPNEILVIPFDPNGSYLVKKLEGAPGIVNEQMPRNAEPLADELITDVRIWIGEGALQDDAVTTSTKLTGVDMSEGLDNLSFAIALSGHIDPASLTHQSVQLYIVHGGFKSIVPTEDLTLHLSKGRLVVTYTGDNYFEGVELRVNDPAFGAVTDMLGRQLDANGDGIPGGMYKHVYTVGQ